MLNYLFPNLLSRVRRQWAYAIGEVVSIAVFALTFSVAVGNRGYSIGLGMPRITALCFMAISAGTFVLATCSKRTDKAP